MRGMQTLLTRGRDHTVRKMLQKTTDVRCQSIDGVEYNLAGP